MAHVFVKSSVPKIYRGVQQIGDPGHSWCYSLKTEGIICSSSREPPPLSPLYLSLSVLLRYIWHIALYTFKMYSMVIWHTHTYIYHEIMTTIKFSEHQSYINIYVCIYIIDRKRNRKSIPFLFVIRILRDLS